MSAIRTPTGVDAPPAGLWTIDPGHAELAFIGRHFGLTKVRGRFTAVAGEVTIGDDPAASTVNVTIEMASVSSGDQRRDDHLRSADFFDVEHHPTATFRSTGLRTDGATATLVGDLTIKDVTRPVTLDVEYLGAVTDPWDDDRAVFSANGRINREDWGLTWNLPLDAGGLLVSKDITIEIEAELIRQRSLPRERRPGVPMR
jgi:polyisoprenoid-binding protein YceI